MKRYRKWLLRIGVGLLALFLLLLIFKNAILRVIVEHQLQRETGTKVEIGHVSVGLFSPMVTIDNLKLYNTPDFGGSPFLNVPELHLELNRSALVGHKIHISLLRLNLAELDVVKNQAGKTNVTALLSKAKSSRPEKGGPGHSLEGYDFTGIDVLDLSFGKFKFIDLANAGKNRELNLDFTNQVFHDVKSEADVYGIAFMIWLRSGGKFSLTPGAILDKHHGSSGGENSGSADTATNVQSPASPAKP